MPKYESTHRPEITPGDLANVTMLLGCFDKLTFNSYGEMVALMVVDLPVVGKVTISLYDRESHIQVYRAEGDEYVMWSGCIYDIDHDFEGKYDRDILVMKIKSVLRDEIAKQLV